MQIHELNTYFGNLDSRAYLAIDNGSDTGKVSAQALLADINAEVSELDTGLNKRIDNIIAGGDAPSAAEVTDARLGAGGTVYPSLGDAIRAQVSSLMDSIDDCLPILAKDTGPGTTETDIAFVNDDKSIASTQTGDHKAGDLINYPGEAVSDFIDLTDIVGIYRYGTTVKFSLTPYAFYNEFREYIAGSYVGDTVDYEIEPYNGKQVTWLDLSNAPANAKYVRVEWQKSRPYTYVIVRKDITFSVPNIAIGNAEVLKFARKKIVNFGDSLFGNFRDQNTTTDKSISKMIADATGAMVYNAGFGGCRMAVHSTPWRAFSMYALADSIASGDWSVQEAALVSGAGTLPDYFADTVAMLKTIDFSTVDYITIGYGVNDYTGNVFINSTDATFANEWDYFKGALEYSLKTILRAHPNIRIAVISPCWMWFPALDDSFDYDSDDPQSANTRGYTLPDYVGACKTVCESCHVAYIDTYYTLGFNPYSYTAYFYTGDPIADGTHPNQAGRQLRADRIVGQLNSLY